MGDMKLTRDPYNLVVTGVGGQGTVLASRFIGETLSAQGFHLVIGDTFGAAQRGGSVMSHLRISKEEGWSPLMGKGQADLVVSFEPIEALRVLRDYGNPQTKVLSNTQPLYPSSVMAGQARYPSRQDIKKYIGELSATAKFFDATGEAMKLGSPVFANTLMIGALSGMNVLPIDRDVFRQVLSGKMSGQKVELNMTAFEIGAALVAD